MTSEVLKERVPAVVLGAQGPLEDDLGHVIVENLVGVAPEVVEGVQVALDEPRGIDAREELEVAARRDCGLGLRIVKIGATVSEGERTESIEMQKVRALEIAGPIEQAGSGHVPQVDQPKAEREDQSVGAQALDGDPGGSFCSNHESAMILNRGSRQLQSWSRGLNRRDDSASCHQPERQEEWKRNQKQRQQGRLIR